MHISSHKLKVHNMKTNGIGIIGQIASQLSAVSNNTLNS